NFCKFTNETRNAIEEASRESGQAWICAIGGGCARGGDQLAPARGWVVVAADPPTPAAPPAGPPPGGRPGARGPPPPAPPHAGGLTRLVDKRGVRRDRADFFSTVEEGVKGQRAVEWRLVDEVVPRTRLEETARQRAAEHAAGTDRPRGARGIRLLSLTRELAD